MGPSPYQFTILVANDDAYDNTSSCNCNSSNQPIATASLSQPNPIPGIEDEHGQPMVLTMPFICQQINMGLNDLICQLSMQLAEIVKPMVENEMQNMHAQELRSMYPTDKSTMSCHSD